MNLSIHPKIGNEIKINIAKTIPNRDTFQCALKFHKKYPQSKVFVSYDVDELYASKNKNIKAFQEKRNALEIFKNEQCDNFIFLESYPCFEIWLYYYFKQESTFFEGYDSNDYNPRLLPILNRILKEREFPKNGNDNYSKSAEYWNKHIIPKFDKLLPEENLKKAYNFTKDQKIELGKKSHSMIWKLFVEIFEKKLEYDPVSAYTAYGIPEEWVPTIQKLGYLMVKDLKDAKFGKLVNDLRGINKKGKLNLPNLADNDVKAWIEKIAADFAE